MSENQADPAPQLRDSALRMRYFEVFFGSRALGRESDERLIAPSARGDTSFHIRISRRNETTADPETSGGAKLLASQAPGEAAETCAQP
jgi:hypothetical protein